MSRVRTKRIVLAVTSAQSLRLMVGFPSFLAEAGWDVHVITGSAPREGAIDGATLHVIPMVRDPAPARDLVSLVNWLRLLISLRPDIVVAGTPKAGLLGMMSAFLARVPVRVYLLRGLRLETESGIKRRVLWLMERITAALSTRVQVVSQSLRAEFSRLGLSPFRKLTVVGSGSSNGVVVLGRAEAPLKRAGDSPLVVGFVGRLHPDKGIRVLLDAFGRVRERGVRARLVLVGGEEPPGYLQACLSEVSWDPSSLMWVGHVADPGDYLASMDVLCLPTRREGFPNVVLEAAAHGVPTIASNVTGCRDAVVHDRTGILVPAEEPEAWAAAIAALASDRGRVVELGNNARTRVEAHFERGEVWRRTEDFYRGLLADKRVGDAT